MSTDPYANAVAEQMSAPTCQFAPFTAAVCEASRNSFVALVIDSQGEWLWQGETHWFDRRLAQIEANAKRLEILAEFARRCR